MKRALAATLATLVGLVLLLGFKTGRTPGAAPAAAAAPPAGPIPGATPTHRPSPASSRAATRTAVGQAVQIPFGVVQVRVTVHQGKITKVTAVQLPFDNPYSANVSQQAGPMLAQEVLSAQSARIDIVSGATYTSDGYAQSLQSALDKLRA